MSSPYQPVVPVEPIKPVVVPVRAPAAMLPPSRNHALLRGGIGALLIIAGIVNQVFGAMFPRAAVVESIYMFGFTFVFIASGAVLVVFAILAATRRSVPTWDGRTGQLSVLALVFSGVAFAAWLLLGLPFLASALAAGERLRYMDDVGGAFFFGIPWMVGLVFAVVGFRSRGGRTALFAGIAMALGLALLIPVLGSGIAYGLGYTD